MYDETKIREALFTLVKQGVYPILAVDDDTRVCIAVGYIEENHDPEDTRPEPRIEYQVSDGLPGERASSCDVDTYEEARKEFNEMVDAEKARRKRR